MCSTSVDRKCELLCDNSCPETCSKGGFYANIKGTNGIQRMEQEWDPNFRVSCV